jgi:hypothetical protein
VTTDDRLKPTACRVAAVLALGPRIERDRTNLDSKGESGMTSSRAPQIVASMPTLFACVLIAWLATSASAQSGERPDRRHLPIEPYQKVGKIAPSVGESDPIDWPKEITAPEGAPNVLLVMMDDVGFGAGSAFGGPIHTPSFDRITREGLSYNAFHRDDGVCLWLRGRDDVRWRTRRASKAVEDAG